jgi:hypothetical protein
VNAWYAPSGIAAASSNDSPRGIGAITRVCRTVT